MVSGSAGRRKWRRELVIFQADRNRNGRVNRVKTKKTKNEKSRKGRPTKMLSYLPCPNDLNYVKMYLR